MAINSNAQVDFEVKRSYNEYPSTGIDDGTVYVKVGSVTAGSSTVDGSEYSSRLGGGTTGSEFLQLDKDKVYGVENPSSSYSGELPCPVTINGIVPGLHGYFHGLKISIPMNFSINTADANNVFVNLKGSSAGTALGNKQVYIENEGKPISSDIIVGLSKNSAVLMEYRTDIPTEISGTTVDGFVVVGNLYDPRVTTDFVMTSGYSTMTGNLKMGNNKITGLANPTDGKDAVNLSTLNEVASQLTNNINSPTNSVSESDTLLSNINGEKQVSYAYYLTQQSSGGTDVITGNTLGFGTSMLPNSCIHIFAYSSAHAKSTETATPYTYSEEDGYIDIPSRIFGGGGGNSSPTDKDYTFINGEATYIGVNGLKPNDGNDNPQTSSQAYYVSTPRRFKIPAYGMIEISVFYNVFTRPGTQDTYSRTVVKCDAEEIPYV